MRSSTRRTSTSLSARRRMSVSSAPSANRTWRPSAVTRIVRPGRGRSAPVPSASAPNSSSSPRCTAAPGATSVPPGGRAVSRPWRTSVDQFEDTAGGSSQPGNVAREQLEEIAAEDVAAEVLVERAADVLVHQVGVAVAGLLAAAVEGVPDARIPTPHPDDEAGDRAELEAGVDVEAVHRGAAVVRHLLHVAG